MYCINPFKYLLFKGNLQQKHSYVTRWDCQFNKDSTNTYPTLDCNAVQNIRKMN